MSIEEKIIKLNWEINDMITPYCFITIDNGETYSIVGCGRNVEDSIVEGIVIKTSDGELWSYVDNLLKRGRSVSYSKAVKTLTKDDLILNDVNAIEQYKNAVFYKAINKFQTFISPLYMFDFYDFLILNNEFASLGYIITNANKEEQYLKIINENDEGLLNRLERYLFLLDKLSLYQFRKQQVDNLKSKLNEASTEEEIDEINRSFFTEF